MILRGVKDMSVIDKGMLEHLKKWNVHERPENQFMMYINSHNRQLTDTTIRKWMSDYNKKDV